MPSILELIAPEIEAVRQKDNFNYEALRKIRDKINEIIGGTLAINSIRHLEATIPVNIASVAVTLSPPVNRDRSIIINLGSRSLAPDNRHFHCVPVLTSDTTVTVSRTTGTTQSATCNFIVLEFT